MNTNEEFYAVALMIVVAFVLGVFVGVPIGELLR